MKKGISGSAGHRERVRSRFLKEGGANFEDYELLELLLFYSIPRADTKAAAKALISEFGSLSAVLRASPEELARVPGIGMASAVLISTVSYFAPRYMPDKKNMQQRLNTPSAAAEFCYHLMRRHSTERLYCVCLDKNSRLASAVLIAEGDTDNVALVPRVLMEKVLRYETKYVFLCHNHPSGNIKPSEKDIATTQQIVNMLSMVDIKVLDHIIISMSGKYFSFAANRIIENVPASNYHANIAENESGIYEYSADETASADYSFAEDSIV